MVPSLELHIFTRIGATGRQGLEEQEFSMGVDTTGKSTCHSGYLEQGAYSEHYYIGLLSSKLENLRAV